MCIAVRSETGEGNKREMRKVKQNTHYLGLGSAFRFIYFLRISIIKWLTTKSCSFLLPWILAAWWCPLFDHIWAAALWRSENLLQSQVLLTKAICALIWLRTERRTFSAAEFRRRDKQIIRYIAFTSPAAHVFVHFMGPIIMENAANRNNDSHDSQYRIHCLLIAWKSSLQNK